MGAIANKTELCGAIGIVPSTNFLSKCVERLHALRSPRRSRPHVALNCSSQSGHPRAPVGQPLSTGKVMLAEMRSAVCIQHAACTTTIGIISLQGSPHLARPGDPPASA